jgi:hypothetical protein
VSRLDLLEIGRIKQYVGKWYAYYRDPDSEEIEEEIWEFSSFGSVRVSRKGKTTFKGTLKLRGYKAYMHVESTVVKGERLFVMLDTPSNPRSQQEGPAVCLWLGQDGDHRTTAGHLLLSRGSLVKPDIKNEFIRAESSKQRRAAREGGA